MKRMLSIIFLLLMFIFSSSVCNANESGGEANYHTLYTFQNTYIYSALWDGNKYIAYDSRDNINYSKDGIVWDKGDSELGLLGGETIANGKNGYVVTGRLLMHGNDFVQQSNYYKGSSINNFQLKSTTSSNLKTFELPIAQSSDGINYSIVSGGSDGIVNKTNSGTFIEYYGPNGSEFPFFWDGKNYVYLSVDDYDTKFALVSADGKTFLKKSINISNPNRIAPKEFNEFMFRNVIFDGKSYFAMGHSVIPGNVAQLVFKSTDGVNWQIVWFKKEETNFFDYLINGQGEYYMITPKNIYQSKDGVNWNAKKSKLLDDIKYLNHIDEYDYRFEIKSVYNNGKYYLQLFDHEKDAYQNRIYITKDMNRYYYFDIGYNIGKVLLVNNDLIITEKSVLKNEMKEVYQDAPIIPYLKPSSVSLSKSSINITKGKTLDLVANILPLNATNKSIIWTSSNNKVVTIDSKGTVKGIGIGIARITARTVDGNKTANCLVIVTDSNSVALYNKVSGSPLVVNKSQVSKYKNYTTGNTVVKVYNTITGAQEKSYARDIGSRLATGKWVTAGCRVKVYDAATGGQSQCYGYEIASKIKGDSTGKWVTGGYRVKVYNAVTGGQSECYGYEIANKIKGDSTGKWVTGGYRVKVYNAVTGSQSECYGYEIATKIIGDSTGKWVTAGYRVKVYNAVTGGQSECYGYEIANKIKGDNTGKWVTGGYRVKIYNAVTGGQSQCYGYEIANKIKGDNTGKWVTADYRVKMYNMSGNVIECYGKDIEAKIKGDSTGKWLTEYMTVSVYNLSDGHKKDIYAKDINSLEKYRWSPIKPFEILQFYTESKIALPQGSRVLISIQIPPNVDPFEIVWSYEGSVEIAYNYKTCVIVGVGGYGGVLKVQVPGTNMEAKCIITTYSDPKIIDALRGISN